MTVARDWYVDVGLAQLIKFARDFWPGISTGAIGDTAHQDRPSDHNPEEDGSVDASDFMIGSVFTKSEADRFVAALVRHRDPRIAYIIWYGRIISSTVQPWVWRVYPGVDPHTGHVHVSVNDLHETDSSPWKVFTMTPAEFLAAFLAALDDSRVKTKMRALAVSYSGGPLPEGESFIAIVNDTHKLAVELGERVTPVTMSDTDRAAITAGIAEQLPALLQAAFAGVEWAPRPNTP